MSNPKATERVRVAYEFGLLIQPLDMLCRKPDPSSISEYRIAIAQVQAGTTQSFSKVKRFTTFAPDITFQAEFNDIQFGLLRLLGRDLKPVLEDGHLRGDLVALRDTICGKASEVKERILATLSHIPVEWEPVVFQANTPFTAYLRIRECMAFVKQRLDYFDRYLKPQFFNSSSKTSMTPWRFD